MSKARMGALVMYCGHEGYFDADIHEVAGANVVRANGKVSADKLQRKNLDLATHHLSDFPQAGYWNPTIGVFVVPAEQVTELPLKGK